MPNTREKPIELISKWDVVNKLIKLENDYNFYKDVWDADVLYRRICELEIGIGKTPPVAYNLSPTEQKWIPVSERLPEVKVEVLVYDGKWVYSRAFLDLRYVSKYGVTHWMPLPKAPKGDNNGQA